MHAALQKEAHLNLLALSLFFDFFLFPSTHFPPLHAYSTMTAQVNAGSTYVIQNVKSGTVMDLSAFDNTTGGYSDVQEACALRFIVLKSLRSYRMARQRWDKSTGAYIEIVSDAHILTLR